MRDVFRRAPGRDTDRKLAVGRFAHPELQAVQNAPHFRRFQNTAQLARQPVEIELDRRRLAQIGGRDRRDRPPAGFPATASGSSSSARARARIVLCGSCAFSNRIDASVRSFSAADVLRTLAAWKFALSRTMEVVVSEIALSRPPITPAIAIGPAASAMTRFDGVSSYSSSFSATIRSPSRAGRA